VTGFEGRSKPPPAGQKNAVPGKLPEKSAGEAPSTERPPLRRINRSQDVRSYLREPDRYDFTISLIAYNNLVAVQITVESLLKIMPRCARSLEVIVAEMNSSDKTADYLAATVRGYANFRVVYAQQNLGEAAGRNIAFRQGRGRYLLLLDAGLSLTGDYFEELWQELAHAEAARPALYGAFPVKLVRQGDMITGFEPLDLDLDQAASLEVEALEGSALCFRRALIEEAGFMDEHFRFPYGLGLDYSFGFRDKGFAVKLSPVLRRMVARPSGFTRPDYGLTADQQNRQRGKNWQLFLRSWQLDRDNP
jgi:glycosyltransferase involved in cell wall biosynthesis